jgi:hypothetical protein
MTGDLVFRLILGHLVGDYLLQNNWMALNKKKHQNVAIIHCLIYTFCILIFVLPEIWAAAKLMGILWMLVVIPSIYFSHYLIDSTNIVDKWLGFIGGRSYESTKQYLMNETPTEEQKRYMVSYTALVQTVADNTLHLLFLYLIFVFLL